MADPTVFVVDDDPEVRTVIGLALHKAGFEVETYDSAEAFQKTHVPDTPGCLVLDMCLSGQTGLELQQTLVSRGIEIPIIFLSGYGDVSMCAEAMKQGAIDFLEKPFDDARLLESVQKALALDARRRRERNRRRAFVRRRKLLTPREKEVMKLMIAGKHTKQIASELTISIKTVDNHRSKVMTKMQVENVVELVHLMHGSVPKTPTT